MLVAINNLVIMKSKKFNLRVRFILLLCLGFAVYSCKKGFQEDSTGEAAIVSPTDAQLILNAKSYFNQEIAKLDSSKLLTLSTNKDPIKKFPKSIDWQKAVCVTGSVGKIVVLPIESPDTIAVKVGEYDLPLNKLRRLFIYTDKKGVKHMEVVTRIPDQEYLKSPNGSKFSGSVVVEDWKGDFIKGYSYRNGEVKRLSAPTFYENQAKATLAKKTNEWLTVEIPYGHCAYMKGELIGCVQYGIRVYQIWVSPTHDEQTIDWIDRDDYVTSVWMGGGAPDVPTNSSTIIKTDSLKAKFPCAAKLIVDSLLKIQGYSELLAPFINGNYSSTATLNATNAHTYTLGVTEVVNQEFSANVYLNKRMLENSSQLLIASTAIHESLHALANYNIKMAYYSYKDSTMDLGSWMYGLDSWYALNGLPSNFSNHYEMLDFYFNKAVDVLKAWDHDAHTLKEYQMATLFGLDNADLPINTQNQARIDLLNKEYNDLLVKKGITKNELNTFWQLQLNATANEKLPQSGCN
jgi:hypothetical protein